VDKPAEILQRCRARLGGSEAPDDFGDVGDDYEELVDLGEALCRQLGEVKELLTQARHYVVASEVALPNEEARAELCEDIDEAVAEIGQYPRLRVEVPVEALGGFALGAGVKLMGKFIDHVLLVMPCKRCTHPGRVHRGTRVVGSGVAGTLEMSVDAPSTACTADGCDCGAFELEAPFNRLEAP